MIKKIPINFLLFAVHPVLFLYYQSIDNIPFSIIITPLFIIILFSIGLFLFVFGICKDIYKTTSIISIFFFFFFLYGHIAVFVPNIFIKNFFGFINKNHLIMPVWFLGLVKIISTVYKAPTKTRRLSYTLNIFGGFLFITNIVLISIYFLTVPIRNKGGDVFHMPAQINKDLRDIYYIILDGYARSDVLENMYVTNNINFIKELEGLGFYIAKRSRSNYTQTYPSIASSLNMRYVNNLTESIGRESEDRGPLVSLMQNSTVISRLRQMGYKIVVFRSGWSGSENLKDADLIVKSKLGLSEFESVLLNSTPIAYLGREDFRYKIHRNTIRNTFKQLSTIAFIEAPTFAYVHILSPHPPFVFDKYGNEVSQTVPFSYDDLDWKFMFNRNTKEYQKLYSDQLAYIDGKILEVLKDILRNSRNLPIIILQSDHGPASKYISGSLNIEGLYERTAILNAYYFPEVKNKGLYSSITPVNSFIILFNKYFEQNNPLLDDKTFASSWKRPYDFIDVTEMLDSFRKN